MDADVKVTGGPGAVHSAALTALRIALTGGVAVSFALLWFFNPQAGRFIFVIPPLVALATFARSRAWLIPWSVYILGFLVFVDLRMMSAEVIFPAQFDYVISLEKLLFLGWIPTVVLQNAFYRIGNASALEIFLIGVHFSFFIVPHALAVWLWFARPALFRRYVFALVITCWIGLVVAFLVPTAPPWLAGAEGRIPHVYRVFRDVMMGATPETFSAGVQAVGQNDVAAMPSLHTALTVLVALAASQLNRLARVLGWTYLALMAFALVYLGEHYVIDILAGATLAILVWRGLRHRFRSPSPAP